MVIMNREDFYKHYLIAVKKALVSAEGKNYCGYIPGPEKYLTGSEEYLRKMDLYIDTNSGSDEVLDLIGIYFDAISHGASLIDGVDISNYKSRIYKLIDEYPRWL